MVYPGCFMSCRREPNSFLLTKSLVLLMVNNHFGLSVKSKKLARIFHESLAATTDMVVLQGVLGCRSLRRTVQVRLETNPAGPRDCPVARPSSWSRDSSS